MANLTADQVEQAMDESMAWRRTELQALKTEIARLERNSPHAPLARAMARSGIALLYAHWEGFTKDIMQVYVEYVAKRRLRYSELNDSLLHTALIALQKRMIAGNDEARVALIEVVRNPTGPRARIPKNQIVDTKSNLRSGVLCEILDAIGFSTASFTTKKNLIDRSLCDARNSIAHGRDLYPSAGTFDEIHREVMGMMEELKVMVQSAVRTHAYRA